LTQQFDIQSVSPIGIDQGDNQLTELSAAMLQHLPLLEQLLLGGKRDEEGNVIVKGNRIQELGAIFGHNEQLQVIDLSENLLQKIDPATLTGLKKLRWLSLSYNKLTTIPAGTLQGLGQLQKFDLGSNKLTTIPAGTFQGLDQLQKLNLFRNKLTTIPRVNCRNSI
jgi:Leucine-rich repeat (LRR) protein